MAPAEQVAVLNVLWQLKLIAASNHPGTPALSQIALNAPFESSSPTRLSSQARLWAAPGS